VAVTGLKKSTISSRLQKGWPVSAALGRDASSRSGWNPNATMTSQRQKDIHIEMHTCVCADCRERRAASAKPRTQAERDARWRRETAARHAWRQSVRGEWTP
jgi:hypothetical protein